VSHERAREHRARTEQSDHATQQARLALEHAEIEAMEAREEIGRRAQRFQRSPASAISSSS